jgi:hypothetical protein
MIGSKKAKRISDFLARRVNGEQFPSLTKFAKFGYVKNINHLIYELDKIYQSYPCKASSRIKTNDQKDIIALIYFLQNGRWLVFDKDLKTHFAKWSNLKGNPN